MPALCFLVAQAVATPSTILVYPGAEKYEYPATGLPASAHETLVEMAGDLPLLAGQVDD